MRYEKNYYDCVVIYDNRGIIRENETREISFNNLKYNTFELIEDETIDIDSIEELDKCSFGHGNTISYQESRFIDKVNELVQVVKQLNKQIKSIKEKN